ncbi:D-inositol 3-phosphate glycosyltransferase [subsurface metagenome]
MKILQVTPVFKPLWESGGIARAAYEISRSLAERGHDVTVYTTNRSLYNTNLPTNKVLYLEGMKVYYFENLRKYFPAKNPPPPLPYYLPFIARKEIKQFDVIHIHDYRTMLAVIIHHYAKKYNIPYVLQPRGSLPRISKSKQKQLFDALFGWAIINDASKIIASSKIESEQYLDVFNDIDLEKVVHIPNGIDLETYQNLPKKGEFRRKYSIAEDKKVILFLSRIHKRKGADFLIEAFNKLKNELEGVKLVIAGPDVGYLDKLKLIVNKLNIEDDVIFPGPLYEKDKLEAYVDADVFVLPSKDRYESFGNVVLEACACDTPVIVTNNCGVSEWMINDGGRYLVECVECNKIQIYNVLYKILTDEDKRKHMSKYAKKFVRKFSWGNIIQKYEMVYKSLANYKEKHH